ncbi:GtrA family protein [Roseburia faecis]|nr:GtrA family protein [Roseburia faecis]OKZ74620.1 MAG: polysaccharide biosynthesis protein GtrA [Clostridiales bacterium 36_14]
MKWMKSFFDIKFLKFICVGVINTLVGTGVMFLAYNIFGLGYWISSAANYVVGSIVSYILNKHFTFKNTAKDKKTIIRFVINIAACYLIAYGLAKPLVSRVLHQYPTNIRDNMSMLVGMGLFVVLNYLSQRYLTFKED